MSDPLDALLLPSEPIAPRARFSRDLYVTLQEELAPLLVAVTSPLETEEVMTTKRSPLAVGLNSADAERQIRWLTDVLGFRLTALFDEPGGGIAFSRLEWKNAGVHVSTRRGGGGRMPWTGPASIQLACEDRAEVDRLYDHARGQGAEVIVELEDTPYGGHGFSLRDPEGNPWNIGIDFLDTEAAKQMPQRRI